MSIFAITTKGVIIYEIYEKKNGIDSNRLIQFLDK